MLLLKVGMRATRGHILQEVVMHVIGIILEKHFQKKELLKQGKGVSNERRNRRYCSSLQAQRRLSVGS